MTSRSEITVMSP